MFFKKLQVQNSPEQKLFNAKNKVRKNNPITQDSPSPFDFFDHYILTPIKKILRFELYSGQINNDQRTEYQTINQTIFEGAQVLFLRRWI